jgi:hypothetical protein
MEKIRMHNAEFFESLENMLRRYNEKVWWFRNEWT